MPAVRVKREELLRRLQSVAPGLAAKEVVEQSSCFAFQNGKVYSYNDELACQCPSGLGKTFAGAVLAKPLLELLEKLPEDEVEVDIGEGELVIVGKRRRAGIRMEAEITLGIGNVETPETWRELPPGFNDAVEVVGTCASADDARFSLTCVHVHPKWLEACDNYQLLRYRLKTGAEKPFLVKRDALRHVTALGMAEIAETVNWVHFRNPNKLILSCRRYLEEYPDLNAVYDVEGAPVTLPGGLAEAVDKASVFLQDQDSKVLIHLSPGKLKVKGQGADGWFYETKKIEYTGTKMEFLVSPKLLVELTKRQVECEVAPERLKAKGAKWTYVAVLSKPEVKEQATPEPVQEEVEA